MKSLIILGDSGFIGSGFLNKMRQENRRIVGINRHRIFVSKNSTTNCLPRENPDLSVEILPFLEEETVVVNAVWGKNNRIDRDSAIHSDYAKAEMLLIDALKKSGCHYMSFGSIAEIDDESISPSRGSAYSEAKKMLADYLGQSGLAFIWLRVASLYGPGDKRDWLLPRLLENLQRGEQVVLENPLQQINLCHIDSFVKGASALIENGALGTFNVTTDQWLTVSELKNAFTEFREPEYLMRILGSFSLNDPNFLHLSTPPIIDFLTEQTNHYRS
jgi:nucleoside-diphosphate-sugar epimerase